MTLTELLEALNTILPHKLIENKPDRLQYGIAYKDMLFVVLFEILAPGYAIISFYEQDEDNNPVFDLTNKTQYSGQLFATVIKIINDALPMFDMVAYTASGKSRRRLYGTLAKKYSQGKFVYIIPTDTIEITVISKHSLNSMERQMIVQTAKDKVS